MDGPLFRTTRIIHETVDSLNLDLSGLTVFTEAATGNYAVTASIAAFAGAETVYAIGADSDYGDKEDAFESTGCVAEELGVRERIRFTDEKSPDALAETDVITNSGFVRPLDESTIRSMKGSGAVSLMYEPWEFRGDVDIEACWDSNIPVVGTDESDHRVRTMEYVGLLPVKLSLTNGVEVLENRYLVLGGGNMAKWSTEKLRALGADVTRINPSRNTEVSETALSGLDALIVVDNRTEKILLGEGGLVENDELEQAASDATVFHLCGPVNADQIRESGLTVLPDQPAEPGHMSFTASDLGPRPLIKLQTAGLAAGAVAARRQAAGDDFQVAVDAAVSGSVGADFSAGFKREHDHPDYL